MMDEDTEDIVWKALQFVTGEIIYGGRVTDYLDRRCLMTTLTTFVADNVLDDDHRYSESGIYVPINNNLTIAGMLEKVKALPDNDNPEIFGMNENADIAF